MTVALRAHRLLCRLGLHLQGRWRTRPKTKTLIPGQWSNCPSCGKESFRVMPGWPTWPLPEIRSAKDAIALAEAGSGGPDDATLGERKRWEKDKNEQPFPVDALNFPPINRQPRDGVTHEG